MKIVISCLQIFIQFLFFILALSNAFFSTDRMIDQYEEHSEVSVKLCHSQRVLA